LAIAAPAALSLLAALARIGFGTSNTTALGDSLFDFGGGLVETLPPTGSAGKVFFGMRFPADVRGVALTLFAVAVVAETVVLGLPVEKLAARPRIARCVLKRTVVFEVAERLG